MKESVVYLTHIHEQTSLILRTLETLSADAFFAEPLYQNALIRSLEIIGEATKNIPDEYRTNHPDIPWRSMTGMRDRLIHGYFTVDLDEVWRTLQENIPALHKSMEKILTEELP